MGELDVGGCVVEVNCRGGKGELQVRWNKSVVIQNMYLTKAQKGGMIALPNLSQIEGWGESEVGQG